MEKEKIRFGRVLGLSILFSHILAYAIFIIMIIYHNATYHPTPASQLNSQKSQANNGQFEAYFGDHVSATEVKQLLSLIKSNNITSQANNENKTIFVNGKYDTTFPVKTGNYYKVYVANEKSVVPSSEDSTQIGNDAPGDDVNKDAGYYKNGFIRNIKIELIESNTITNTSSQNLTNNTNSNINKINNL